MYYIRIHSLVGMVSMQVEMVCCRKIVALCQSSLMAGYYYHHLLRPKRYDGGGGGGGGGGGTHHVLLVMVYCTAFHLKSCSMGNEQLDLAYTP